MYLLPRILNKQIEKIEVPEHGGIVQCEFERL